MLGFRRKVRIETERMSLRLPSHGDWTPWAALRAESSAFLTQWEPVWSDDHLSRKAFTNRVYWAARAQAQGTALPVLLVRRDDQQLLGAITLDNIRRGPAQAATVGYWIGQPFARQGFMREAIQAVVHYAFTQLDLSRVEAACLPENTASRGVLEKPALSMRVWRKAICKFQGGGATMCSMPTCAVIGGGARRSAKLRDFWR